MNDPEEFSRRNREFDYLQLRWLEKMTGRPSHDWDLYILKELLDNALDADERWAGEHGGRLCITVELRYGRDAKKNIFPLEIAVGNRAPFPADRLETFFDVTGYASSKSHLRFPSRGQQGNALKTILGIPYALHHHHFGDYDHRRRPLDIETGGQSYAVRFGIDEAHQSVALAPVRCTSRCSDEGTWVRIGVDRFEQEKPRSLADLRDWAVRYALFNPHVTFAWRVRIGEEEQTSEFSGSEGWAGRFADTPPIHWYDYTQLRELLLALQRNRGADLPLIEVPALFAGFTPAEDPGGVRARALCRRVGAQTLGDLRLVTDHNETLRNNLWVALRREGRVVPAERLGGVGEAWAAETLTRWFRLETPPLYRRVVVDSPTDPTHPFVLELAIARLPAGQTRRIWTGLNHTPTYEDPFYTKPLLSQRQPDQPVYGLDGFLDAHGLTADQPILLVAHVLCPNLEFQDFSKTVIEARPFRDPLAAGLDALLTEFTAVRAADDLQPLLHDLLPQVFRALSPDGRARFSIHQAVRFARRLLSQRLAEQGPAAAAERLADPEADTRLRGYIQSYLRQHREEGGCLLQPDPVSLFLPLHPQSHVQLSLGDVEAASLDTACVNKILVVSDPELEHLLVQNRLLARFDMALIHSVESFEATINVLIPELPKLGRPLLLLHHATAAECGLAAVLRDQLARAGLAGLPVYDLGLTPAQGKRLGILPEAGRSGGNASLLARDLSAEEIAFLTDRQQAMSLFSLTLEALAEWLEARFAELGLSIKARPSESHLRLAALAALREHLGRWVLQQVQEQTAVEVLVDRIMQQAGARMALETFAAEVGKALAKEPFETWKSVMERLASERIEALRKENAAFLERLTESHLAERTDLRRRAP